MVLGKFILLKVLDMGNDKNCEKCGLWNRVKGDFVVFLILVNL